MTHASPDDDFTKMFREYVERLKEKLGKRMGELPPGAFERALSSLVAAAATILLVLARGDKKREGIIGAILAAAARYLAKHASEASDA